MPVLTSPKELAVGMKLQRPVHAGLKLLLPADKVLNAADIDFIIKRVPRATVYVTDPVFDEFISFHDDARDRAVAQSSHGTLVQLMTEVQHRYASRTICNKIDCQGIRTAVSGAMMFLSQNPVMSATLAEPSEDEEYLVSHTAHVFYLSMVIGDAVRVGVAEGQKKNPGNSAGQRAKLDLTPLALAALFMDIGMWPLRHLYEQSEPLTLEQCEQLRNHPVESAASLPSEAPEITKLAIETHHENFDGSGYPYGLSGEEIHIFARILRIADTYAAATTKHAFREACSPVRALWEMTMGPFSQFYDPVLLKIFYTLIQPFPIGARVRLNTGQYGVVVRYGRQSPFLPEIVIAFDETGSRLPANEIVGPIRLDQHDTLGIAAFGNEDLSYIQAEESSVQPVTPAEFSSLHDSMHSGHGLSPTTLHRVP